MGSPAFIYAFDTLGPDRFAELCTLLLSGRYRGFLVGGVGPDEGVDGIIDPTLASWKPDTREAVLNQLVEPDSTIVFQYKHKVVGRVGEAAAREQLLRLYRGKDSEIRKHLVQKLAPSTYVLVTNVEVSASFREAFASACRAQSADIKSFLVLGLDELSALVTLDRHLRTLYFPALFGHPRFDLQIIVMSGESVLDGERTPLFQVNIANTGLATSCIADIRLCAATAAGPKEFHLVKVNEISAPIESGRAYERNVPYEHFASIASFTIEGFLPTHVRVADEIGNVYEAQIPTKVRETIIHYAQGTAQVR